MEPIAITGMSCRLPGPVDSPDDLWRFLLAGGDAVGEVSADRWTDAPGVPTAGGFRADVHGFDAQFFGLSPREAAIMDPQQRIVLELAWEALVDAGIRPSTVAASDAGVYIGVNSDDHGRELLADLSGIEAYSGIGSSLCAIPNRVSHALDLRGPSIAVDTACSASLAAIHLACQALRADEVPLAVAGGVMLMIGPGLTAVMAAAGALSPSGRSRPFAASADGYARGEGAGLLVLKRLSDAERDGDRVHAVIRGSAVRQDGRTDGIMAPSREAQAHLLRAALAAAALEPADITYVEAHGTGTRVGDPTEAAALAEVYGDCLIGSVKSNIGHLEAASGVAGVIKTVLALRHGVIPPTLHFDAPNPEIPPGLRVVDRRTDWPDGPRRAGVSGYGYGGTIAHLVLEQTPERSTSRVSDQLATWSDISAIPLVAPTSPVARPIPLRPVRRASVRPPRLYPLSGASPDAVLAEAERLATWLGTSDAPLADVAHTLAHRRDHLAWRATVPAMDRDDLIARLAYVEPVRARAAKPVFVFSGHGSQWVGMGAGMLATEPVFVATLERLDAVFATEGVRHPVDLLQGGDTPDAQIAIFAVQIGLAAVWARYGVEPAAIIGHSVGEIAAAVVAGALTEADGARLICRRSALLREVAGTGAMAVVPLSFEDAALPGVTPAIAAGPKSTVVSGTPEVIERLVAEGRARRVATDIAFHSPHVHPLLDRLAATTLNPRSRRIPLYSTTSDDPRDPGPRDGAYWAANLGNPVRFTHAIEAAIADGHGLFLEVSPHPVVTHAITETDRSATTAHTLRRNRPERLTLLDNLGRLHSAGVPVDWHTIQPDGTLTTLPPTAWQHQHLRVDFAPAREQHTHNPATHDLLGHRTVVHGPTPTTLWRTRLDLDTRPYPGRHPVLGVEIVPAAVLLATFLRAADTRTLTDVTLKTPVPVAAGREIQILHTATTLRLSSGDKDDWVTHTTASTATTPELEEHQVSPLAERLDPDYVTTTLAEVGVAAMGFPWRISELSRQGDRMLAQVTLDPTTPLVSALDAALSLAATHASEGQGLRMPAHIRGVTVADEHFPEHVTIAVHGQDLRILHDTTTLATLTGIDYGAVDTTPRSRDLVHRLDWTPTVLTGTRTVTRIVVLHGETPPPRIGFDVPTRWVTHPEDLTDLTPDTVVLVAPGHGPHVGVSAFQSSWLLLRAAAHLARRPPERRPTLWCLTRGVLEATALDHSSLWGVARVLAGEHPDFWGGLVDLHPDADAAQLLDVFRAGPAPDILTIRDGETRTPRLITVTTPARPLVCRPDGTYLVTGGLGALGREVAHWLADRGARRLVLVGRRGLPPRELWDDVTDREERARVDCVRELESAGVTVRAVAMDLTDRLQAKLLTGSELGLPPIRGVVHAAGVLDTGFAVDVDALSLIRVMRPKIAGALVLHEMFPPGTLDFLTLFSSAGPLLGLPGQAAYAAANAFLDALATHRGHDTVSLAWTSWRGLGMSTTSESVDAELRARGTGDITAAEAFAAWDQANGTDTANLAILRTIPDVPGTHRPPLLAGLTAPETTTGPDIPDDIPAAVAEVVAAELRVERVDQGGALAEAGVDSVLAQAIRVALERRFGVSLPATLFWDRPSVRAVAAHLDALLHPEPEGER
ncbi:type I polyketide synthase [Actinokineospora enzanensis]|uniref:type I polyketide synthase n=1 Tax=Actinokineospora enzanensis TaxID=155975 RepID=UPI0003A38D19|nr:type I polyketide synthase [Actinokineospora enzanensis]